MKKLVSIDCLVDVSCNGLGSVSTSVTLNMKSSETMINIFKELITEDVDTLISSGGMVSLTITETPETLEYFGKVLQIMRLLNETVGIVKTIPKEAISFDMSPISSMVNGKQMES